MEIGSDAFSSVREQLMQLKKPAVIKNALSSWSDVPWSLEQLRKKYGSTILTFRVVHISQKDDTSTMMFVEEGQYKNLKEPVWEADAHRVKTSLENFIQWVNYEIPPEGSDDNPFSLYSPEDYWVYSSYNYMDKLFPEDSSIMKGINWAPLGFAGRYGNDSTFWVGSAQSNTPCHIDSYGCNLVAQIIGRKQWVLFPPEDSGYMYMTRIPYEESSVFSGVNTCYPDLETFPLFRNTHPYVVTLEPGDVLFVPSKWWHYVSSLETSVSVNTWVEIESDDESRFHEAIAKSLMSIIIPTCDVSKDEMTWLNPGETILNPKDIESLINEALLKFTENIRSDSKTDLVVEESSGDSGQSSSVPTGPQTHYDIIPVPEYTFAEYWKKYCYPRDGEILPEKTNVHCDHINLKSIINCIMHPDVLSCIADKLVHLHIMNLLPDEE